MINVTVDGKRLISTLGVTLLSVAPSADTDYILRPAEIQN
jgi:hypothetical protein